MNRCTCALIICFCCIVALPIESQNLTPHHKKTIAEYIESYREDAIREMHEDGIPASITLAQGIKESNAGNSPLALNANNHFGIKCQKEWEGMQYIQDDDLKNECFRKYNSVLESYADHSDFLKSRPRYAFLFLLDIKDYKGWANGLKAAGYATDPSYAKVLIKLIEDYKLYNLDTVKNPSPELVAKIDHFFGNDEKGKVKDSLHLPAPAAIGPEIVHHKQKKINGVPCIVLNGGETLDDICLELEMEPSTLYKYNELENEKKQKFTKGQVLYLQSKKNKGSEPTHVISKGENMYHVSQKYGVKLKKLYAKNHLKMGTEPNVGTTIQL